MFKKIKQWRKSPLVIPRSLLTAKYFGFAVLGVLVFLGGLPTLDLLTFHGYTTIWAAALFGSSLWGAVYSFSEEGERREKIGAVVVFALLATWAVAAMLRAVFGTDDVLERIAGAWAVVMISLLPGFRAYGLLKGATE